MLLRLYAAKFSPKLKYRLRAHSTPLARQMSAWRTGHRAADPLLLKEHLASVAWETAPEDEDGEDELVQHARAQVCAADVVLQRAVLLW